MLHFSRSVSIIGAPLALAALLAWVTPAGAGKGINGMGVNGMGINGFGLNGLSMNGSALGDLNGVVVEAVILPDAPH